MQFTCLYHGQVAYCPEHGHCRVCCADQHAPVNEAPHVVHRPEAGPVPLEPLLVTIEGAAAMLQLSPTTVKALVARGHLRPVELPGLDSRRFRVTDLKAFVENLPLRRRT